MQSISYDHVHLRHIGGYAHGDVFPLEGLESYISCTLFIIYWTVRFIMQVELRKLNTGSSIHMPNVRLLMCCGLLLGYHLHNSWHYYFFSVWRGWLLFGFPWCTTRIQDYPLDLFYEALYRRKFIHLQTLSIGQHPFGQLLITFVAALTLPHLLLITL